MCGITAWRGKFPDSGRHTGFADLDEVRIVWQYPTLFDMEMARMPNVPLTGPIEAYARGLMERDGARQFYALKADLEAAMREAIAGAFDDFDPDAYEPEAGLR